MLIKMRTKQDTSQVFFEQGEFLVREIPTYLLNIPENYVRATSTSHRYQVIKFERKPRHCNDCKGSFKNYIFHLSIKCSPN